MCRRPRWQRHCYTGRSFSPGSKMFCLDIFRAAAASYVGSVVHTVGCFWPSQPTPGLDGRLSRLTLLPSWCVACVCPWPPIRCIRRFEAYGRYHTTSSISLQRGAADTSKRRRYFKYPTPTPGRGTRSTFHDYCMPSAALPTAAPDLSQLPLLHYLEGSATRTRALLPAVVAHTYFRIYRRAGQGSASAAGGRASKEGRDEVRWRYHRGVPDRRQVAQTRRA